MIILLSAVKHELLGVKRRMVVNEEVQKPDMGIYKGEFANKKVLLGRTGMGRSLAEATAEYILNEYPVEVVINFGYAGAISPDLKVGDLFAYKETYSLENHRLQGPVVSDEALYALAKTITYDNDKRARAGIGMTINKFVAEPEEKIGLGDKYPAQVVDMESYWIGKKSADRGLPFISLRSISDTVYERLPDFTHFVTDMGTLNAKNTLLSLLQNPGVFKTIPRFLLDMRNARDSMTSFLWKYVTRLEGVAYL